MFVKNAWAIADDDCITYNSCVGVVSLVEDTLCLVTAQIEEVLALYDELSEAILRSTWWVDLKDDWRHVVQVCHWRGVQTWEQRH